MLRSPAPCRGSRAHALAGPGARRPGARRSGGRSCRHAGQPAPDASQDGLSHRLRYGWRAGRWGVGLNRHPGKLWVRVCLRGCQAGSQTLGLRDPRPRQREAAWEPGGGYLPVESLGTPKGSHWGASGLQKNSTLSGVLTRDAGCQILLRG